MFAFSCLFLFLFYFIHSIYCTSMETAVRKATRLDYNPPKQKHLQSKRLHWVATETVQLIGLISVN